MRDLRCLNSMAGASGMTPVFVLVLTLVSGVFPRAAGAADTEPPLARDMIVLPRTGQTVCYDSAGYSEVPCAGTRQDGEIRAGAAWPNPRFVVGAGVEADCVTDRLTGLVWARNADLPGGVQSGAQALEHVASINSGAGLCGHNDWRLPNANELYSLVNSAVGDNSVWLTGQGFTGVMPSPYWSSTTYGLEKWRGWVVDIGSGSLPSGDKGYGHYVWPVRSGWQGQTGLFGSSFVSVPRTGQTRCYDFASISEIPCSGTGQDAEFQIGRAWPEQRFQTESDSTIADNLTGLAWAPRGDVPTVGDCAGGANTLKKLYEYIACLNTVDYLGHDDWRMPNRNELVSLRSAEEPNLSTWLNTQGFAGMQPNLYFTSTSWQTSAGYALSVELSSGVLTVEEKSDSLFVLPVRAQTGRKGILVNQGAASTGSVNVTLSLSASDPGGVTQVRISNDGVFDTETPQAYSVRKPWTLPSGDGQKAVHVVFGDPAGNWSAAFADSIVLDTTPPAGSIDALDPSGVSAVNEPGEVPVSNLESVLDFEGHIYALTKEPLAWQELEALAQLDGGHLVTISNVRENQFLAAHYFTYSYGVFTGYNDIVSEGEFVWADGDNPGFENWAYGEPNNAGNQDCAYLGHPDGSWDDWDCGALFRGLVEWQANSVALHLACVDAVSGCAAVSLSNDNAIWSGPQPYAASVQWSLTLGDGTKTVYAKFQDKAGNWSDPVSSEVVIDTIAPNAPVVTGAAFTSDRTPTWNWTSGGGGGNGSFRHKLDNSDLSTGATETTSLGYTPETDMTAGPHTLYVRERDEAGNWSVSGSFTITIDVARPQGSVIQMLSRTGQEACFDAAGGQIACSGTGQDGEILAGQAWPAPRFTNHGDGTITDELTGLMWAQNASTPTVTGAPTCTGYAKSWQEAFDYVTCLNANNYLGHSDWRVSNVNELKSLVNYGVINVASWLTAQGFTNVQTGDQIFYRSSTPRPRVDPDTSYYGSVVSMKEGYVGDDSHYSLHHVWPVRGRSLLPVTGATSCFSEGAYLNRTDCAGTGQDGEIQAGLAWPEPRFVSIGSCVTDTLTGLMWPRDANRNGASLQWQAALDYVSSLNTTGLCGHKDWHVPNTHELGSLVNYHEADSAAWLSRKGFLNLQSDFYWTSDTYQYDGSTWAGWGVQLSEGEFIGWHDKVSQFHPVWPVRRTAGGAFGNTGITVNQGASHAKDLDVRLGLSAGDANGVTRMRFSNEAGPWSAPVPYSTGSAWALTPGDGTKTVSVRFLDAAGNLSPVYSDMIVLDTLSPVSEAVPGPGAYSSAQNVTLSANEAATIYYSTDGSTPSRGSKIFAAPIVVSTDTMIKFFALDKAGNAEEVKLALYIIDSVAPQTVASPLTGIYPAATTVTLTCSDGFGTGCVRTHFTTDGSTPTASSPVYANPIVVGSTTVLRFFSLDAAGNAESVQTETYIIDTIAPVASVSSPADDAVLDHLHAVEGAASDALSGVARVELQITDGTWYVDANQQLVTTPTWVTAGGAESWSFNTSLVDWVNNTTYTITARSIDRAGNLSADAVATFTKYEIIEQAYTTLLLDLSSQTILQNETLDFAGKLTRLPDNGFALDGLEIAVAVTAPDGSVETFTTTTYDVFGHFLLSDVAAFSQKGTYSVGATYAGNLLLAPSESDISTLLVGSSAGYAIVVEGKIAGEEGLASHNKTANRVYGKLRERGFVDDNIYYFNYDTAQEGVDDAPTKAGIQYALESWAKLRINGSPAPLYLIMVDHGNPGAFLVDSETVSPEDLDAWLTTLEAGLNAAAYTEKRIVIIGACYSGSFVPALSGAERIIVASAADDEESYKGPNEPDGIRSGEFFLEQLFQQLGRGDSLKDSFSIAVKKTEQFTRKGDGSIDSGAPYFDGAAQHPLLDDNGDGTGSNLLVEGGDGDESTGLYFGVGTDYTNSANQAADIVALTPAIFLGAATASSRAMWFRANDNAKVSSAWMEVRPPLEGPRRDGRKQPARVEHPQGIHGLQRRKVGADEEHHLQRSRKVRGLLLRA